VPCIGFFLLPTVAVKVAADVAFEANTAESQGHIYLFRPSPKIVPPVDFLSALNLHLLGVGGERLGCNGFAIS
jgi:hypothetical protein